MAENELQILIKGIFSRIKEKYGYTDEQALIYLKGYEDCAEEHQQSLEKRDKMLRDTVAELCEAKRLLRLAVEDFNCDIDSICAICKHNDLVDGCPYIESYSECEYNWRYTDEALKLIGGSENG